MLTPLSRGTTGQITLRGNFRMWLMSNIEAVLFVAAVALAVMALG